MSPSSLHNERLAAVLSGQCVLPFRPSAFPARVPDAAGYHM
jgi:hypothetical protein